MDFRLPNSTHSSPAELDITDNTWQLQSVFIQINSYGLKVVVSSEVTHVAPYNPFIIILPQTSSLTISQQGLKLPTLSTEVL